MAIVTILPGGRIIARTALTDTVVGATTDTALPAAIVTDLKKVEYVLQINLNTDPDTYAIPHDASIAGNAVGLTVYTGAGTTVGGEILTVGF